MKSPIFWDITSCSLLKVNRRFGEICVQSRRISQGRNQQEAGSKQNQRFFFDTEEGENMFFRNVCWLWMHYTALGLFRKQFVRLGNSILTQRLSMTDAHFRLNSVNSDALVTVFTRIDMARNASQLRIAQNAPHHISSEVQWIFIPTHKHPSGRYSHCHTKLSAATEIVEKISVRFSCISRNIIFDRHTVCVCMEFIYFISSLQ
jgi:hypothetical protein